MADRIGFIGLGKMGGPMARRLAAAGHRLVVCDADAASIRGFAGQGHEVAATAQAVADRCEIVFASLPTPEVVREVALGPASVARGSAARLFIDVSTTGPKVAIEAAEGLRACGIAMLDSPVSGGIQGAEKGSLALMVSGPAEAVERARPALECLGRIFVVGAQPGQGQTLKVLNNLLAATSLAATAEILALGAKAGLDPALMLGIVNAGTGRNFMTENWFPKAVDDPEFAAGMNCRLMFKDVRLGLEVADLHQVPLWVGVAVRQLWAIAAAETPAADFMRILQAAERSAGSVVARAKPAEAGSGP
jgi:3-hydroxyisobutyrate dehydrogenase-like beta-hydroxyacid dehydrogenase